MVSETISHGAQKEIEFHISTFTPINEEGEVDYEEIDAYVKYLGSLNVDGISILGLSGEGTSLTIDERKKTAERFVTAAKKYSIKNVNIHITSWCDKDIQVLAEHAEQIGASTVSILPNMFHRPSCPAEIMNYLERMATPLVNTKILYTNVPEVTGVYTRVVDIIEFGSKMPKFGGVHDSGVDLTDLGRTIWASRKHPHLSVYCSRNVDIMPALAVGCTKFVGPSMNFCLPIYRLICQNFPTELGIKQQQDLLAALTVCCKYGLNVAMLKACTEKISGVNLGTVRSPLHPCRPEVIEAVDSELNAMDFWKRLQISSDV